MVTELEEHADLGVRYLVWLAAADTVTAGVPLGVTSSRATTGAPLCPRQESAEGSLQCPSQRGGRTPVPQHLAVIAKTGSNRQPIVI